ncbi:hypothetical protein N7532_011947 [Penicillium argentinense]|uniref:Uncharacterized protein n=1 Tax=Penicillium argentinense TaxID=1131581 RepID=A0A9W9JV21_9EURO|nr:uncharacterized protein N7532_011947 [Penicillium argentinense]KAJ5082904.1 hypothetical protein N7532_011947 [Penicillium argentinense]
MEHNRAPALNLNFATFCEELKLPSFEDFRVHWHAKMLAAKRYFAVLDNELSLSLHLDTDLYASMLESSIRQDFSSERPRVVENGGSFILSWIDVVRETTDESFKDEGNGLFSCYLRGCKVQMPAKDRDRIKQYYSIPIARNLPQPQDIRIERDTISDVRKLLAQCKQDREAAAKFEDKLDDCLSKRDFQLREYQENSLRLAQLESSPRKLSSKLGTELMSGLSTHESPENGGSRAVSSQTQPKHSSTFSASTPVPQWSRGALSPTVNSNGVSEQGPTTHGIAASGGTGTELPISASIPARSALTPIAPSKQAMPSHTQQTPRYQSATSSPDIPISGTKHRIPFSEEERLHSIRFISFLIDKKVPWSRIPSVYAERFRVHRTQASLTMRYYSATKEERVPNGYLALDLRLNPRLRKLVEELEN